MADERQRLNQQVPSEPLLNLSAPLNTSSTSNSSQASRTESRNMEFAPLPSQQFDMYTSGPFDMRTITNSLPDYRFGQSQPAFVSQAPVSDSTFAYATSSQPFAQQIPAQYLSQLNQSQNIGPGPALGPPGYVQHSFQGRNYNQSNTQFNFPASAQRYDASQNRPGQIHANHNQGYVSTDSTIDGRNAAISSQNQTQPTVIRRSSSDSSTQAPSSALRGPPRKPRQSGYALWVGNLPPSTHIIELKDHFSKDATNDIDSCFLISKSNCAFVNYRTEESCTAAMARFHDSRFKGVRLVCRLRRGSASAQLPATLVASSGILTDGITSPTGSEPGPAVQMNETDDREPARDPNMPLIREKFFVVKSLTVEDLERSLASGIWATQAHNEKALTDAFKSAENVYLIFSANKSGEYFGFARMDSAIGDVPEGTIMPNSDQGPVSQNTTIGLDVPVTIPTPATNTAPKGRIIDDSARGTIFWESDTALSTSAESSTVIDGGPSGNEEVSNLHTTSQPGVFGKPFRIVWQSTERLPFYRTRGLRNPWNANREVKIARDGTEIEPSVGRKLIGMFEQQAQINAATRAGIPSQIGLQPQYRYQYQPQPHQYGQQPQQYQHIQQHQHQQGQYGYGLPQQGLGHMYSAGRMY